MAEPFLVLTIHCPPPFPYTPPRYTMLLGRPPFETTNRKETYRCIREARYSLPSSLSSPAKQLISSLLTKSPEDRPHLDHILRHDFFIQVRRPTALHRLACLSRWSLHRVTKRVSNWSTQTHAPP